MPITPEDELKAAVDSILESDHPKKLIVAGAGAGKTFTFKKLLERLGPGDKGRRLVTTFIGGLKRDLDGDLGGIARVNTFHGFCYGLLIQSDAVRTAAGFASEVKYFPRLGQLIKSDWILLQDGAVPKFVTDLRNLTTTGEATFFLERGRYYCAVGFEDSIAHVHQAMATTPTCIPEHDLIIVDEFQDFNRAEVSVIDQLAKRGNLVIAGDDDQALYGGLRDASEEFIRECHQDASYATFNLPFCMRCPSVVVEAAGDIITAADGAGLLGSRIAKRYDPFPRAALDGAYSKIKVVRTTVARIFGKYIDKQLQQIPLDEIHESHDKGFPTALVIVNKPYSDQVLSALQSRGWAVETKQRPEESMDDPIARDEGIRILKTDANANLGWRILLEVDRPEGWQACVTASTSGASLVSLAAPQYRDDILREVDSWEPEEPAEPDAPAAQDRDKPTVRLTSFEGAKGMSAQHVFIVGTEDGKLPIKRTTIRSLEIRRMLVALTRTRRQCYLIYPAAAYTPKGRKLIKPSVFIDWIGNARKELVEVSSETLS